MKNLITITFLLFFLGNKTNAQLLGGNKISYETPKKYEIGGITVDGAIITDEERIISYTGLTRGSEITIPGNDISSAIKKLWEAKNYSNINIYADRISGNTIFLKISLTERLRMSFYKLKGITNSQAKNLKEVLGLYAGKLITESLLDNTKRVCRGYFIEKGYLNTKVNITSEFDTAVNSAKVLIMDIDKGERVKIKKIEIEGNNTMKKAKFPVSMFKKEVPVFSDSKIKSN